MEHGEVPFTCSGFCFEKRYFITTRHFDPVDAEALAKMFVAESASDIAKIATLQYSGLDIRMLLLQPLKECLSDVNNSEKVPLSLSGVRKPTFRHGHI
jgi:hypothetical protein